MIVDLNRNEGVTIILTTHVMEEAEELCDEIALLREGELVAHQRTGELTRSLGLARPIRVTVELQAPPRAWQTSLLALPAVTDVQMGIAGAGLATFTLESVDLRATTPALIGWLGQQDVRLVSMEAEPVTLTDVFLALNTPVEGMAHGS
jgi:ABC-2 type transport system ATP-binding protein